MTARLTSVLVLAGFLGLASALPAVAAETVEQLEAEAARYTTLATEQAELQKHFTLSATASVKGGHQARAAYHGRQSAEYRAKAELYASRAQELRDAAKRVAQN